MERLDETNNKVDKGVFSFYSNKLLFFFYFPPPQKKIMKKPNI